MLGIPKAARVYQWAVPSKNRIELQAGGNKNVYFVWQVLAIFDNYTPSVSRTYCLKVARLVAIMDGVGMILLGYVTYMLTFIAHTV